MKSLILFATLTLASAPVGRAAAADESIYFEVTVSKDGRPIGAPQLLVKPGADAAISFPVEGDVRLGFRTRVDQGPDGRLYAGVTTLANDQVLGTEAMAMTREDGGEVEFASGAYTFHVRADVMNAALREKLMARRRAARP